MAEDKFSLLTRAKPGKVVVHEDEDGVYSVEMIGIGELTLRLDMTRNMYPQVALAALSRMMDLWIPHKDEEGWQPPGAD
jgi:hypothetical protein